jgi:hypothetical protein
MVGLTWEKGRLTRREALRLGAVGLGGLTLPELLRLEAKAGPPARRRARSVILLFLSGGPSHLDMFDLKPDAPEEVRGTFRPIDTTVSGIQVGEHLPRLARLAEHFSLVRSVRHEQSDHPAAAYWMMIGQPIGRPARDAGFMSRVDRPHPGSALAKVLGPSGEVPPFVLLPEAIQPNGPERSGQFAGFLGAAFDPYRINSDSNLPDYTPGAIEPPPGLTPERMGRRRLLLDVADEASINLSAGMDAFYTRAFDLIASPASRRAFDIAEEPGSVRDRYGRHVFGQSVLLARRMVEAGVRLVHVNWVRHDNGKGGQGYDSHRDHLDWCQRELLPPTDAAIASLLEDLRDRGLLDETLMIVMGEFGRTPRFNKDGGRDHWPHCFSVLLAGGGIRGGQVLGASDRIGAYPASAPVSPADLIATLYETLGVDPSTEVRDQQDRPWPLSTGRVLRELL